MVLTLRASSNHPSPSTETAAGQKSPSLGLVGKRSWENGGEEWDVLGQAVRGQGAVREESAQVILPQGELCPPKVE